MINKYTNKQRGLLAVIMAMVMVFAGAAFVATEVDANIVEGGDGGAEGATCVAKIGDKEFGTLQDAIDAVTGETPATIILQDDVVGQFNIAAGKNVVIDLNGHTISSVNTDDDAVAGSIITNNGTVTIKNTNVETDGVLELNSSGYGTNTKNLDSAIMNYGVATIDGIKITRTGDAYYAVYNEGELTISGSTEITATNAESKHGKPSLIRNNGGEVTINNGTFDGGSAATNVYMDGFDDTTSKLTINGGTFNGSNSMTFTIYGEVTVNGGTFSAKDSKYVFAVDSSINAGKLTINKIKSITSNAIIVGDSGEGLGLIYIDDSVDEITVNIWDGAILDGSIQIGDSKVVFMDGIASSGMKVSKGSVVIEGAFTKNESGKITITSGTGTLKSNIPASFTVEVAPGATLNVANTGITNDGIIINNGTLDVDGTITNTGGEIVSNGAIVFPVENTNSDGDPIVMINGGSVAVQPGQDVFGITSDTITSVTSKNESFGMSKDLESDYTIRTSAFLQEDLIIPEGITLTVAGTLDLNGKNLIVKGILLVEKKGQVIGYVAGVPTDVKGIILSKTGVIQNDGLIGKDSLVVIIDEGKNAEVRMMNVIGLSFGLTKEIPTAATEPTYTLTVSGEATKKGDNYRLTMNHVYVTDLVIKDLATIDNTAVVSITAKVLKNGSLTIGSKADVTSTITLMNGSNMIIEGDVVSGTVTMHNGTTATVNGSANGVTFSATTGEYPTYDENGKRNNAETYGGLDPSTIILNNITGITIEITSKTYTDDTSGEDVSMTEQMLDVYGVASFVDKTVGINPVPAPSGTMTVTNTVYVPVGAELVLDYGMSIVDGTSPLIITEGLLKIIEGNYDHYEGASYTTEVPGETSGTIDIAYYTNFDDAYANIATADDMTITLRGGYEFTKTYVIAAEQSVEVASEDAGIYTITKDGKITVEEDGSLFDGFKTNPAGIKGTLVVMNGGDCKPVTGSYEVSSKDADGNMTYTSAELAIENSKEGDTIQITGTVTFEDPLTIPAGVTVEVAPGAKVTAKEDLTVEGELINDGTVDVEGDLKVPGEIDNIDGALTVDGNITVTGEIVSKDQISVGTGMKLNAATFEDDGNNIYTNVADAVAASAEMDVPTEVTVTGDVSETSDITLVEGQTLVIDGTVVLKSVRLVVDSELDVTTGGKLTADIIGATGVQETTGALADSTVSVKEVVAVKYTMKLNESTTTVTMYMEAPSAGTITVATGSVELTEAIEVVKDTLVLKVSEGAELVVKNALSGDAKAFSNAGTLKVADITSITGLTVGGTIDVVEKKALTISDVTVSGTLTTDEDASVTVADGKYMYVGSKPTTLGAAGTVNADVSFGTDAYVVVFDGSTFTNTDADVKMDSTAYTINDIAFATVYILENATVDIETPLNAIVLKLEDLQTTEIVNGATQNITIEWKSGSSKADTVGQYDTVNAKIGYASVDVTISVGPGMLVYIDDIKDTDGKESLTIGTHTITVYIEKGYEGTPAITLNGVAVTDGKLVITTDMMDLEQNLLSVTGATVMQDQPVVIQPSDSEKDGMELTDILLIVLVVLIVIMAIIVALRMMRS